MPDQQEIYEGKKIAINMDEDEVQLYIDGEHIRVARDGDSAMYYTNRLAYREYPSLMDLAKGIIDDL